MFVNFPKFSGIIWDPKFLRAVIFNIFWRVLSLKLKRCLYKSYVRSVMSYGSECWSVKKVETRRMQAAEMRMIRMMCRKTLRDGIPNGLLRDRTGVEWKI